jgi:fructokinase
MKPIVDTTAQRVLVIGESHMEVVRLGGDEYRRPAGSPMNVAYGLARLGADTRFLTGLGSDADGDAIRRHLASAGVKLLSESEIDAKTSESILNMSPDGSTTHSFNIDWKLPSFSGLQRTKWIHVGSISTFLAPGADSLERLLRAVQGTTSISYDPNIRPSLIGEHVQALRRFERIAALAKVVKLSNEDAAWLYPSLSEDFVIDKILTLGPEIVALTMGAAGARISTQASSVHVPAPSVEVVDTIGAGDSFMAAFISALLAIRAVSIGGRQLEQVAKVAVMAAAITCSRDGAEPPSLLEIMAALSVRRSNPRATNHARH